ncbi:MAG: hypothetical protein P1U37_00710 [Minwuia sp.]|nr:hypothetical protein [Minwuia sp.]
MPRIRLSIISIVSFVLISSNLYAQDVEKGLFHSKILNSIHQELVENNKNMTKIIDALKTINKKSPGAEFWESFASFQNKTLNDIKDTIVTGEHQSSDGARKIHGFKQGIGPVSWTTFASRLGCDALKTTQQLTKCATEKLLSICEDLGFNGILFPELQSGTSVNGEFTAVCYHK